MKRLWKVIFEIRRKIDKKFIRRYLAVKFAIVLFVFVSGCASHALTSSPPGAAVWFYEGRPGFKLEHHNMTLISKEAMSFALDRSITYKGEPGKTPLKILNPPRCGVWYQVTKEGYEDSKIIFLYTPIISANKHNFVLKPKTEK